MQTLSNNQRRRKLEHIRAACQVYITGSLKNTLAQLLANDTNGLGSIDIAPDDPDGQTLLLRYPRLEASHDAYVRPVVRIESGAKSALDPHRTVTVKPYIADDVPAFDFSIANITAIDPRRTFWDKIVIVHGLRRWYERRGIVRQEGQRISRHYYDLHCLLESAVGSEALADRELAADCVAHARMFFDRPDFDLAAAAPGSYAIAPVDEMIAALRRDYSNTIAMVFGSAPAFDKVMESITRLDMAANQ